MENVYLSLGSNIGDRLENLRMAVQRISELKGLKVEKISSVYETEPVGNKDQPAFLNLTIKIFTEIEPYHLLTEFQRIERELGRIRDSRWGPRTIDIDLLYYGNRIIQHENLKIPHPQIPERKFVLIPLCEIAPYFTPPEAEESIQQLLSKCPDNSRVGWYASAEIMFEV